MPSNGFFDQFEKNGGVKRFISVALASLQFWQDKKLAESWGLWLKELDSFSQIPLYFQQALKNKKCKDLLKYQALTPSHIVENVCLIGGCFQYDVGVTLRCLITATMH